LLGAALTVAATTGSPARGAVLLLAYASGIGAPFLLAPLVLSAWPTATRRLTRWSVRLAPIAAAGLVVLGVLLVTGLYTRAVSPLARWIPGVA
jgi:cytochrome c-type biogenesis protein